MINVIRSGMNASMKHIDQISNNIANARTTGFKRSISQFEDSYSEKVSFLPPSKIGIGSMVTDTRTSRTQGPLMETGQTLDLAIEGQGLFVLNKPGSTNADEAQYTRDGSFTLDVEGYIIANDGQRLKSSAGNDFRVPRQALNADGDTVFLNELVIDTSGNVIAQMNDRSVVNVGRIGLAVFADETRLKAEGRNLFSANQASGPAEIGPAFEGEYGKVISGALEMSNTDMTKELTDLMRAQQAFSGTSRLMQAETELTQRLSQ
jgi:flagellar hook protein FlgE